MEFKLTEEQKKLIEEIGVSKEQEGLQPAAARVYALLFVSNKTELTFDEIREALKLSKSATSNALNFLLSVSIIEYITLPGDRKRYFRMNLTNWGKNLQKRIESGLKGNALLKKVLNQRPPETAEFNQRLAELIEFTDFLQKEIPLLLDRWNESRRK